jgi:hypothetical protein
MPPRLRSFIKEATYWVLPEGAKDMLKRSYKKLQTLSPDARSILERNAELKDKHLGNRCFILATGPSIKNHDLSLLEGEICISVANFFVHSDFNKVKPLYHCIPPLHEPLTDEDGLRWFRKMEPYMDQTNLILGYSDSQLIELNSLFNNQKIYYLQFGDSWHKPANQSLELTYELPACQSVSIMALMVAIYIGCSDIYLLGTDHTVFKFDTGQYDYGHFYDKNDLGEQEVPDDMENEFRAMADLWRQYKYLRTLARTEHCMIYNATGGGFLDLFQRVDYKTLF